MIRTKKLLNIVNELRAIDNLDEEKWKQLKYNSYVLGLIIIAIITYSFIYYFEKRLNFNDKMNLFLNIIIFIFFAYYFINYKLNRYLLYSYGSKTIAEVIEAEWKSGANFIKYYSLSYFYHDEFGKKYDKYNERHAHENIQSETPFSNPKTGDKIPIIYLRYKPKIVTSYNNVANQKYNLRKNQ